MFLAWVPPPALASPSTGIISVLFIHGCSSVLFFSTVLQCSVGEGTCALFLPVVPSCPGTQRVTCVPITPVLTSSPGLPATDLLKYSFAPSPSHLPTRLEAICLSASRRVPWGRGETSLLPGLILHCRSAPWRSCVQDHTGLSQESRLQPPGTRETSGQ